MSKRSRHACVLCDVAAGGSLEGLPKKGMALAAGRLWTFYFRFQCQENLFFLFPHPSLHVGRERSPIKGNPKGENVRASLFPTISLFFP